MAFTTEFQDRIAIISLNRPERLNALTKDNFRDLAHALETLGKDDRCDAIILTGTGRGFCTGFSLDSTMEKLGKDDVPGLAPEHMQDVFDNCVNPMIRAVTNNPKPVVTAINGMAAGGGVGVALCGDVVLASSDARFQLTFVPKLGIMPDAGSSWFLSRLAGRGRALPAMLLGEAFTAQEALNWGLIWQICEASSLLADATEIAQKLASGPTHFYPEIRRASEKALQQDLSAHLDYEGKVNIDRCATADFAEGIHAFLGKREPDFPGR